MKWNSSTWLIAFTWTLLLSGCASTPTSKKSTALIGFVQSHSTSRATKESIQTSSSHLRPVTLPSRSVSLIAWQSVQQQADVDSQSSIDVSTSMAESSPVESEMQANPEASKGVPINLPTALAMIGGQHPVVGFARWRVQEAYAQLDRAKVMWLPSIQSGFNYRRRDGNYQDVQGSIVDVDLNSLNFGLGAGAVAAGSPTEPGIVAQFHLADAIFLPKATEKTVWARGHALEATLNQQLLAGSIAYIDLLEAYQEFEIISEAVQRTNDLAKITRDYAEAGQGLQSDSDRTATELALLQTRQLAAREQKLVASSRLARALSIPMTSALLPQDSIVVPFELLLQSSDEATLIANGLSTRPELKESQALVAAACEAYKREKYAPFVPSLLLGFSTSRFGGGIGNSAQNFGGRYDLDAMMVWEMRNLGFGERAARRERNAQVQQANFAKLRILDQVAQEVAEANAQVNMRRQQLVFAQNAIVSAHDSYQRNMDRIREGQGLPIEVLQSIQALESSQRTYMNTVASYNRAQLQLQWALGWPVGATISPDRSE